MRNIIFKAICAVNSLIERGETALLACQKGAGSAHGRLVRLKEDLYKTLEKEMRKGSSEEAKDESNTDSVGP